MVLALLRIEEGIQNKKKLKQFNLTSYKKQIEKWINNGLDVQDIYAQYQEVEEALIVLYAGLE